MHIWTILLCIYFFQYNGLGFFLTLIFVTCKLQSNTRDPVHSMCFLFCCCCIVYFLCPCPYILRMFIYFCWNAVEVFNGIVNVAYIFTYLYFNEQLLCSAVIWYFRISNHNLAFWQWHLKTHSCHLLHQKISNQSLISHLLFTIKMCWNWSLCYEIMCSNHLSTMQWMG